MTHLSASLKLSAYVAQKLGDNGIAPGEGVRHVSSSHMRLLHENLRCATQVTLFATAWKRAIALFSPRLRGFLPFHRVHAVHVTDRSATALGGFAFRL